MRYSVNVPNFGEFAAPEVFAEVARRAEEAGWDALLVGDSVAGEKDLRWEIADPWILLTAAALATSRIGWARRSRRWPGGGRPSWPGRSLPWTG